MDSGYSILSYNEDLENLKIKRCIISTRLMKILELRLFLLHKRIRSPKIMNIGKQY